MKIPITCYEEIKPNVTLSELIQIGGTVVNDGNKVYLVTVI